jgi:hypothetical protein
MKQAAEKTAKKPRRTTLDFLAGALRGAPESHPFPLEPAAESIRTILAFIERTPPQGSICVRLYAGFDASAKICEPDKAIILLGLQRQGSCRNCAVSA